MANAALPRAGLEVISARVQAGVLAELIAQLPGQRFDAIVSRPPVSARWMTRAWRHRVPSPEIWHSLLRVVRPGGRMVLVTRPESAARMAVAIEDAGWWSPVIESRFQLWAANPELVITARNPGLSEPGWLQTRLFDEVSRLWSDLVIAGGRGPMCIEPDLAGLWGPLVARSTPPRGLVLDPWCGTGETIAGAIRMGRSWHGLEVDLGAGRMAAEMARAAFRSVTFASDDQPELETRKGDVCETI